MKCDECGNKIPAAVSYISMTVNGKEFCVCEMCLRTANTNKQLMVVLTPPVEADLRVAPANDDEDIN
jgi:hypothetical protein